MHPGARTRSIRTTRATAKLYYWLSSLAHEEQRQHNATLPKPSIEYYEVIAFTIIAMTLSTAATAAEIIAHHRPRPRHRRRHRRRHRHHHHHHHHQHHHHDTTSDTRPPMQVPCVPCVRSRLPSNSFAPTAAVARRIVMSCCRASPAGVSDELWTLELPSILGVAYDDIPASPEMPPTPSPDSVLR